MMHTDRPNERSLLIIGAGLSGLLAAQQAVAGGWQVTVVDKGRTVGGRLATRFMGPGYADHGAQFFTVRDPRFRAVVDRWQAARLIFTWGTGWSAGSLVATPNDGHPRYAVHGGMNALARVLATELTDAGVRIQCDRQIVALAQTATHWQATDKHGATYTGNALLLTPPVPQSLALLDASAIALTTVDRAALAGIEYAPCLCGIFWLEGQISLPTPGAIQRVGADISWVADNHAKGISPDATLITVHAGPDYSAQYYDAPDDELLATFQASLQPFTTGPIKRHEAELKRWRYALPTTLHPDRFLRAHQALPLFFGGDAFGHPRVEGAALSGMAIGDALMQL